MHTLLPKVLMLTGSENPKSYYWTPKRSNRESITPRCFSKDSNSAPTMAAAARIYPGCPGRFPWFFGHENRGLQPPQYREIKFFSSNIWWFQDIPGFFWHQNGKLIMILPSKFCDFLNKLCVFVTRGNHLQMDPKCLIFRNFINSHPGSNLVLRRTWQRKLGT